MSPVQPIRLRSSGGPILLPLRGYGQAGYAKGTAQCPYEE